MINAKLPMLSKRRDIHERIYKFALSVLNLIKIFPKSTENLVLVRQLVRSATSIGANASEADGAESKKEFIQRFTIAKKEAKETFYWLSLLGDHNPSLKTKISGVWQENKELIAIISKIVLNAKRK